MGKRKAVHSITHEVPLEEPSYLFEMRIVADKGEKLAWNEWLLLERSDQPWHSHFETKIPGPESFLCEMILHP